MKYQRSNTLHKKWAIRLLKFLGWLLVSSLLLLLLVVCLLNTKPAQQWLTEKADKQLSEILQTDLGIGHIGIGIPKMLSIEDVYLNTPAGDTLARVGYLGVNINMWALLHQQVEISSIKIADVYGNVVITDSSNNIQFLLDAFTPQDTVVSLDTSVKDSTASSWVINLNDAQLDLAAIDIYYQDDPAGLSLDIRLSEGHLSTDTIDLSKQYYLVDELTLRKADVVVKRTVPSLEQPIDSTASAPLLAGVKNLQLKEVRFDLLMDEIAVKTKVPALEVNGFRTSLDENIMAIAQLIKLEDAQLSYDLPNVPQTTYGLDPNHLAVTETNFSLSELRYQGDSLSLFVDAFSTREQSGLAVDNFTTDFQYHPRFIALKDLALNTPQTALQATNLYYALPQNDTELLKEVRADAQGVIAIRDLLLLVPQLRTTAVLANHSSDQITFHTHLETVAEDLMIDRLDITGPGMLIRSRGQVRNPLDLQGLSGSLLLEQLSFYPKEILPLVPEGLLPAYITWPEQVVAAGEIAYRDQKLALRLRARENRLGEQRWSSVAIAGTTKRPLDFPNTLLDLTLDSLLLTRPSILAYLPPNTLPAGYQWPSYVQASGRVSGPVDDLEVALQFFLPDKQTFAKINGNIKDVMKPEELYLDVGIEQMDIRKSDVLALLPDSLLPAQLNLPDFSIVQAKVKGTLDDLSFYMPVSTTNGNWVLEGKYKPQDIQADVQITGIRAADFFVGAIRDTLLALDLQPLHISATINGQLTPQLSANVTAKVSEQHRGQLLELDGLLTDSAYQAHFTFDHPYFSGDGFACYQLQDSTAMIDTDLNIKNIDLARWGMSDRPLVASGKVVAFSNGLDPRQLKAHFELDDLILRGDGSTSFVDSLRLDASFEQGNNVATISGDMLEGKLSGQFDPVAIVGELSRFFSAYLREEPFPREAVVNGSNLNLHLQLKNPRPLTAGWIEGLTELSPVSLSLVYRDQTPELKLALEVEQISYANLSLSGMQAKAEGTEKKLIFSTEWQNVALGGNIQLGRTQISGQSKEEGIDVALAVFAHDSIRHRLALNLQERDSQQIIVLADQQIINFETWQIPKNNLLSLSGDRVAARNWKLSQGNSFLQLRETDTEGLSVAFQGIRLDQLSRIINSEEELISGTLNGELHLDQLMTNLGIRANVAVADLAYYQQAMGDLEASVKSEDNTNFDLAMALVGAGNKIRAAGLYQEGGLLDINVRLDTLQMASIEPFSLGYLQETGGYLTGNCTLGGTLTEPILDGRIDFKEVALAINLLGSRYRINEQSILFNTREISFNDFTLLDDNGNTAVMSGEVLLKSVNDIRFNLTARTRDFLAIDSEAKDNDLFYGYLRVNADVLISGNLAEPRLVVTAAPTGNSELTYAYSAATQSSIQTTQGVVSFIESYELPEILNGSQRDTLSQATRGAYIETNLRIDDKLLVRVIVDPITQQEFSGRGVGDITFIQFPNGQQQMTGQIAMKSGRYDMVLEGLQRYTFGLEPGSRVYFTGDPTNPQLDLKISNTVKTSPLPLVQASEPGINTAGLRKPQTFKVVLDLKGDMQGMDISADILYPDDSYGNNNISSVSDALSSLRQNQSRVYTTAITLMTFKNFVLPLTDQGGNNPQQEVVNGVAGAVGDALSSLLNNQLGFVDVNLGLENYETSSGEQNYNLRLSLQKSFLDDRLIVSVDGVTNTAADAGTGEAQTYLDNVSVAYLLDKDGNMRIKLFNDRDRNVFVGGNVLRFGGRLVFSKNFDRFFWQKK